MELALIVAALLALLANRGDAARPFTFAELTKSNTALRLGIDNSIPAEFHTRARGLCVIAGVLRSEGFRITSAWRSDALNEAVRLANAAAGTNQATAPPPGLPGDHNRAKGLDVAPTPPSTDRATMEALRARLLSSGVARAIDSVLVEENHCHVAFDASTLEAIGQKVGNV